MVEEVEELVPETKPHLLGKAKLPLKRDISFSERVLYRPSDPRLRKVFEQDPGEPSFVRRARPRPSGED
jgi:hypothetical protein